MVFQFLIGRIKTFFKNLIQVCKNEFQFLIGRIKTKKLYTYIVPNTYKFQFLIGRIKTCIM